MVKGLSDEPDYLPCKKCGADNMLHDGSTLDCSYITCLNCHFSTQSYLNPFDAIKEWNEREL